MGDANGKLVDVKLGASQVVDPKLPRNHSSVASLHPVRSRSMKYLVLSLLSTVAFGLANAQSDLAPASPQVESKPNSVQAQQGLPNGRSDRNEPFFKTVRLPLASDPSYGMTPEKPIRTGPRQHNIHILLLNSLRGTNGEPIEYERKTSCCFFEDKNLPLGGGMFDVYVLICV